MALLKLATFWIPFLLFIFVARGFAQTSSTSFDLEGAIQYALQKNLDIVTLQKQRAVAQAEILTAQQRPNPSFLGEGTRSQPNFFVGLGYLFELGGKRKNRIEVARNGTEVANLNLATGMRDLRHDVRIAFYKVLQFRDRLNQISLARDLARKLRDISKERFEAGVVPKFDVLQAELELKRRENDLQKSQSELKKVEIELNLLLNREPQEPLEIIGSLEGQVGPLTLDSLVEGAMSQRVELKILGQQRKEEEARLSLARSERIPDLQVEAGTEIHDAEFQYGWRASLGIELPLLNQRKGEIAGANATLESLKAEEASARQKVRSEITEAYLSFQAAQFRLENYRKEILPAAAEMDQLSQESYHEGKSGIISALDAQRNTLEVRLEYLEALLDFQTAIADLEKAAGTEML